MAYIVMAYIVLAYIVCSADSPLQQTEVCHDSTTALALLFLVVSMYVCLFWFGQVCDVVERVLACNASGEIWRACAMVGFLAASCGRETDDDDENDDHEVSAINARLIAEAILRETPQKNLQK